MRFQWGRAIAVVFSTLFYVSVALLGQTRQGSEEDETLGQCRLLLQEKRAAAAVPQLKAFLAQHPGSASGNYLLAYAYLQVKEPRLSLEQYTRSAALRAPSAEDLMAVSADYIVLQDYPDAAKWLRVVTSMQPSNALAWYYQGRALHLTARYPEALEAFSRALLLSPQYTRAEVGIGLTKEAQGDDAGAMEAYAAAMKWQQGTSQHDAQPFISAGELLLKQGDNAEALRYLQTASSLSHNNPRVLEDLGKAYERVGQYVEATTALQKAEQLAPASSSIHFLLGTALMRQGRKPDADKEFLLAKDLLSTSSSKLTENFDLQP